MKYFIITAGLGIVFSFFVACKKDNNELPAFDYEKATGLWVPYEAIENGTTNSTSGTTTSLFGSYAASVQLNKDQTFIPVFWLDQGTFIFQTAESGNYQYLYPGKLIFKDGLFDFECEVLKFQDDELWLKMFEVAWKFKKQ